VNVNDWEAFLSGIPSTVYHTPQWKQFLEKVFGYAPVYLFALGDYDEIIGFLPLFWVKGLLSGTRLCSVPFGHVCGPLGSPKAKDLLVHHASELIVNGGAESLEVRGSVGSPLFRKVNSFSTFILDLEKDPLRVWKRLDKGSVRWAINRAEKRGVRVERTRDIESVKLFYELNCLTKRDLGIPCHPWSFFKALFEVFRENVCLYLAKQGDDAIGGGVFLYHRGRVLYGYGAADPEQLDGYPYNAFIWASIKDACEGGCSSFDFGRTSYSDAGLFQFKKRWGTVEEKLYYSYFPGEAAERVVNRKGALLSTVKKCVSRVPLPLYKKISERTFTNLG
jgi:hypothetical protein